MPIIIIEEQVPTNPVLRKDDAVSRLDGPTTLSSYI